MEKLYGKWCLSKKQIAEKACEPLYWWQYLTFVIVFLLEFKGAISILDAVPGILDPILTYSRRHRFRCGSSGSLREVQTRLLNKVALRSEGVVGGWEGGWWGGRVANFSRQGIDEYTRKHFSKNKSLATASPYPAPPTPPAPPRSFKCTIAVPCT